MLVLSRRVGESIIIDDRIEVTILEVGHNRVKIGVCAPKNLSIHRKEVERQIHDEDRLVKR